jgi:hypothetical protein
MAALAMACISPRKKWFQTGQPRSRPERCGQVGRSPALIARRYVPIFAPAAIFHRRRGFSTRAKFHRRATLPAICAVADDGAGDPTPAASGLSKRKPSLGRFARTDRGNVLELVFRVEVASCRSVPVGRTRTRATALRYSRSNAISRRRSRRRRACRKVAGQQRAGFGEICVTIPPGTLNELAVRSVIA